jgi:hypothetical protein
MSLSQAKKRKLHPEQQATETNKRSNLTWLLWLIVFCWPFVYLHSLVFVIDGRYRALSNDFIDLYYKYKVYLLDNLANFHFPLWSPAEAAGYPFYSNPFTQAFYPFNVPLALIYKILGGYIPFDHQIFTILGVSIFALGLFMWLRLLNANLRAAVFAAIVMSVSFKVTEILRFPNAVHSAAWYPWILYALTRLILHRSAKEALISGVLLCLFLICLCAGGYPYYVYYAAFLFVPYLLALFVRPLRQRLISAQLVCWKRAITVLILAGLVTGIICAPYLLATKHLMDQTTDRGGKNYEYSASYPFSFEDTVGSLVYPPAAQAEGWYFFSITALLMIVLYLLGNQADTGESWSKIFFIGWIALISYTSYGRQSYLFDLLWKYMPGFSSLRAWGRLNIILVPIIAWLLSLAYASFETIISGSNTSQTRKQPPHKKWIPLGILILGYSVILAVQIYLYQNEIYDRYWFLYFRQVSGNDVLFITYGIAAFTALFLLLAVSRWNPVTSVGRSLVLVGLVLVAALEMEHVGTRTWTIENQQPQKHVRLDVAKLDEVSFFHRRIAEYGTISLGANFSVGTVRNWYFNRYVSFLKKTQNEPAAQELLLGVETGQKVFFSQAIEYASISEFLKDAMRYPQTGRLLFYNGDQLRWEIDAPIEGYLSFIDNWDNGWKAFVDSKPAKIDLLFGTFKSVRIPAGLHHVRISYQPGF